jgi:hypothetical protein
MMMMMTNKKRARDDPVADNAKETVVAESLNPLVRLSPYLLDELEEPAIVVPPNGEETPTEFDLMCKRLKLASAARDAASRRDYATSVNNNNPISVGDPVSHRNDAPPDNPDTWNDDFWQTLYRVTNPGPVATFTNTARTLPKMAPQQNHDRGEFSMISSQSTDANQQDKSIVRTSPTAATATIWKKELQEPTETVLDPPFAPAEAAVETSLATAESKVVLPPVLGKPNQESNQDMPVMTKESSMTPADTTAIDVEAHSLQNHWHMGKVVRRVLFMIILLAPGIWITGVCLNVLLGRGTGHRLGDDNNVRLNKTPWWSILRAWFQKTTGPVPVARLELANLVAAADRHRNGPWLVQ